MADLSKSPDNLVPFLETVASTQKANIIAYPEWYDLMRRVNICLATAGQNMINPKPVMCGVLFLRCQYAYKTAAGLSLAGQVSEAFVMMRSCLEYAGYALAIFDEPNLEQIFANRHVSTADMQARRRAS